MWSALARGSACGSAEALECKKRRLVTDTITSLRRTAHPTCSIMSLRTLVPNSGSPSTESVFEPVHDPLLVMVGKNRFRVLVSG